MGNKKTCNLKGKRVAVGMVRARAFHGFDAAIKDLGGVPNAVWSASHLAPSVPDNPDSWIPFESVLAAYEQARRNTDCPFFGMYLANFRDLSYLGPLILIFKYSANLKRAWEAVARYSGIQNSGYTISLAAEEGTAALGFTLTPSLRSNADQWIEETLVTVLMAFREFFDDSFEPLGVRLAHDAIAEPKDYRRFFGVIPEFNAENDALLFDVKALSLPNPRTDKDMVDFLDGYLGARVASARNDLSSTVRALLADLIPSGEYSIDVVADLLNLHRRTLQRRLADEGVRYADLLDQCRAEIAVEFLEERSEPIVNLAHLLGYSDQSSFNHAFRRWHGVSPTTWAEHSRKVLEKSPH